MCALKSLTINQYFCKKILSNLSIKTQIIGQNDYHHTQIVNSRVYFLVDISASLPKKILGNLKMKTSFGGKIIIPSYTM